ncbi:LytTR family DNA-binding domain-containing protein [Adlercreutzia sp. R25]|uniref:LytTR family DNA-binding domain-containing protein n=1 Tax=Adlercreutzia shanghongiae TaxID=3111773 RepID=UPI002DB647F4|nr:LytTR family DNA-binding domain-containing protein [Adlercreutzia sp. R25]MEC4272867.1 LytTR family DNA-binding domain-containing protein [Adlercreutzia sp. R25]
MKLTVEEHADVSDIEVDIRCVAVDRRVQALVAAASALDRRLVGTLDGATVILDASEVLYAETVDGRTFLYGPDRVLESPLRLYELEEQLAGAEFVRASKSLLVNFDHVRALRPYLNARLELILSNGESVIASRQYAPAVKAKIGL